ncbi:hypothetical protein ACFYUD_23995 [Nocardia tengchongensis]|uniref:hypothetical protein n=1 Tax=Nocardia tengchongensis TaxID=2055889 RepID=UPI0036CABAF1
MRSKVWMTVTSSNSHRDNEIDVEYFNKIDRVVVTTGSGDLFLSPTIAAELFEKLRDALQDGALTQAITSGTGLWLTATEFVPAERVSDLEKIEVYAAPYGEPDCKPHERSACGYYPDGCTGCVEFSADYYSVDAVEDAADRRQHSVDGFSEAAS